MVCYCCGIHFMGWQYLVNPWVKHALRSPECTHLMLSKGRDFVEEVHESYNLIKTCNIWVSVALIYLKTFLINYVLIYSISKSYFIVSFLGLIWVSWIVL